MIVAAHDEQLRRYGGLSGLRDEGLLKSAIARPENLLAYGGDEVDIWQVAASLGYGLAKNHPFIDGNKRTSLAATYLVLLNAGYRISASDDELLLVWRDLAAGEVTEGSLVDWLRANTALAEG